MTDYNKHFDSSDAQRAALRTATEAVGACIDRLPRMNSSTNQDLHAAWAALIELMALGEPLQLRNCPRCGHVGMRQATRCGHCWVALTPPAERREERQVAGGADS